MLPNRVSVNLFAGSLIINIITIGYTTRVPSFSFTGFTLVINLAEIVNPCLQLVILGITNFIILCIDRGFEPMNPFTGLSLESSCFNHLHKRIDRYQGDIL